MKYVFKHILCACTIVAISAMLCGASNASARPLRVVDDKDTITLKGNVHPLARPEFDRGEADASLPMERMILTLRLNAAKQAELDKFLAGLHDPASPHFHHWILPEEFNKRFGPVSEDLHSITGWLMSHGFTITEIAKSGAWINFSGTVDNVERAFHTRIHNYYVNGHMYHANAQDPAIPRGISDLVAGIVSLHNFPRKMMNHGTSPATQTGIIPSFTSGSSHYLSPGDFATIYDINPLYGAGIDGSGQSIAIVGRTHPFSSDWTTFRSMMGLPASTPQVIVNGPDPGDLGGAEDNEADLDVEWSGAVAINAAILFVTSQSTEATDGVDLSAQYIVNNNLAAVMSTSFGSCESDLGSAENNFYNNLWKQAAAQGITSFVASGDAGAAGCDAPTDTKGSKRAINGLASTPYNVAVGGTEFNEGSGSYWNTVNGGSGYTSAISYIPETAWNESGDVSGGSGLWATGGGVSTLYVKPAWQISPGVPADGMRDVPDVSLSSAVHDAYLVETQGALYVIGGTSASSPSFAGLMALIVQKTGQRQGNANNRFYQLGNAQYGAGGVAVFHDITSNGNSVPGVAGYSCTTGFDQATGLGSVDANSLVMNWIPDFSISVSPVFVAVPQGSMVVTTVSTTASGNFNNAVSLSASGLPSNVTASFGPASISAPGSGSSTLTINAVASSVAGTFPITVTGIGGGITHTATGTLTILQTFSITSSVTNSVGGAIFPGTATVVSGGNVVLTITPTVGYHLAALIDNGVDVTASVINGNYTITNIITAHTVIATFAVNTYNATASVSSGNGSITPTNAFIEYGSPVTFTISPDIGFILRGLTDNGLDATAVPAGNGNYTYTIASIAEDHTIVVTFFQAESTPALGMWEIMVTAAVLGGYVSQKRQKR
ncbi:MAG TPA: protease pro-enzyme activation domain-containing protein [Nitrospirota bacterium]|nr:protease pro-enzyme activation domain-containing protein [Nitrospirota bacterium]